MQLYIIFVAKEAVISSTTFTTVSKTKENMKTDAPNKSFHRLHSKHHSSKFQHFRLLYISAADES